MRLSVVIPFNKGLEYLNDCLTSLKNQIFKDFEVIIVEDKPVDNIDHLVENFSDLNLRRVSLTEGTGVASARNEGIAKAKGEYILLLDADDYLLDDAISKYIETIEKNNNPELVYGDVIVTWYSREGFLSTNNNKRGMGASNRRTEENADNGNIYDKASKYLLTTGELTQENMQSAAYKAAWEMLAEKSRYARITALGCVYRKDFITESGLRFDESFRYYSDIPFVVSVVINTKSFAICDKPVYVKRKHNNAVDFPSLSQEKDGKKLVERVASYEKCMELIGNNKYLKLMLDEKMLIYFASFYCNSLRCSSDPKWRTTFADSMYRCMDQIPAFTVKACSLYQRRLYKAFVSRNLDKVIKIVSGKALRALIKRFFRHPRTALSLPLYHHVFMKKPVRQDWVLFESFLGKTYGDSCRYIYEYMVKKYPEKKYIWIIDNKDAKIPGKHIEVKPGTLRYFYYAARAGLWVNNMRQPTWYLKREGMYLLETWHGTPLKKLVFDMEDVFSASARYKMTVYKQSRKWDYLVSDNRFSTEAFSSCFRYPKSQITELGYPRNDLLYGDDKEERARSIKKKLGIPTDKKVVLYAPTWRDDEYYAPGQYKFDLPLDLKMMRELKDEYVFILRTHYFIADHLQIDKEDKDFVFDCSRYNDIGELYLISDILITDYSSVFFDFANLRRPILFYVYDFEKYGSVLRGFYFDMATGCPGPLLRTNEQILDAIKNIDKVEEEYKEKYKAFCDKFCYLDDGHAAERITEKVLADIKAGWRGEVGGITKASLLDDASEGDE